MPGNYEDRIRGPWLSIDGKPEPFMALAESATHLPWPMRGDLVKLPGGRLVEVARVTFHYQPDGLVGVEFVVRTVA